MKFITGCLTMKEILNHLLSFSLLLIAGLVIGQTQVDFKQKVGLVDSLMNQRDFENALKEIETIKASIQNTSLEKEDSVQLYFLSKLSFIHFQLGDCQQALASSRAEVNLRGAIYGDIDIPLLQSMRNLGVFYLNCDSVTLADSVLSQVVRLHRSKIGKVDELYVRTIDDLAFTKSKIGQVDQSFRLYAELIDLLKENKSSFYFNILNTYVNLLINHEKYDEASGYYEELKDWERGQPDYDQFLKDFHNVFILKKDYVKVYETAEQLFKQKPGASFPEIALNAARAARLMDKYDTALLYYEKAFNAYDDSLQAQAQLMLEQAEVYNRMGKGYKEIGTLIKCKELHESNQMTDSATYASAVLQLGSTYTGIGEFELADKLFKDYLAALEKSNRPDYTRLAEAYQSLGNQKYLLRDYNEADLYLNKAIDIIEDNRLEGAPIYASCLNSIGALNEAIASYDQAKKSYEKAYRISKGDGVSKRLKVASASNLANIINWFDPLNDSISILLKEALVWQGQITGRMHPDFANLLNKRGLSLQRIEQYDSAEKDYKEAAGILEYTVGLSHPEYLVAIANLGLLYAKKGKDEEALKQMLEARKLYEAFYSESNPGYILTINNLANQYTKMGLYDQAEELFLMLTDIELKAINESFTYLSENEKKDFVKAKRKFLDNLKKYIVTRYINEGNEANEEILLGWYNLELNIKGILLNSTKKVRDQIFSSENEGLIDLFSDWTIARKQVAELQSLKSQETINSGQILDSLNRRIADLEKELSRSSAAFGNSFSKSGISYEDIKNALGPAEASIEMVRIAFDNDVIYVALYATKTLDYPKLIIIGKDDPLEKKAYATYKNTIAYKVSSGGPFEAYWKPVEEQLVKDGIEKLYFVPDGVYHRISLVTLYDPTAKEFLLDKYEIYQLTSSKDVLTVKSSTEASGIAGNVLLMGRPHYTFGGNGGEANVLATRSFTMSNISDLPGTQQEIEGIDEVLLKEDQIQVAKYLGDQATENNFKSQLDAAMIHIATHGFFFDKEMMKGEVYMDPMLYSGLLLAGVSNTDTKEKTGEDGILTAYEIMNLGFSNLDMVVLSACETGTGEISSGEGVYGLQRAFLVAGANSLIMSMWKVDDQATKDLMTEFYKELFNKGDKREAFMNAQKKIKKKYKSPIYWGAFVMVGS